MLDSGIRRVLLFSSADGPYIHLSQKGFSGVQVVTLPDNPGQMQHFALLPAGISEPMHPDFDQGIRNISFFFDSLVYSW